MSRSFMSDAYKQGQLAYFNGDDLSLNPFDKNDEKSDEWDCGWMDAYADSK